ncbi:Thiol-disulfide isomerase or thioredoxin [Tenacibaculum sp. MAR_2009_124]|uniref:TlpA disulfide reductase family protein n=1 Tax=Tenacibaculum sp. MAR_2009_124 TaxID=1250059 RepID=UPI00089B4454|nr:TlpA disulfide reductase family protein [Tenacibaculum sp. MAR_2009_124]SEB75484.1 Thiol-disulfide isomerase or thioredoxin [Tenacibaculum sp. MAR_2009_124]
MLKKNICFSIVLMMLFCTEVKSQENEEFKVNVLNYEQLKPLLNKKDSKIYVVNFWATWCVPCVKELPAFEKLNKEYKNKNVEVILVSLDLARQKERSVIPFLKKKNIRSSVLIFNDSNEQFWIEDIAKEWTGSIPATIIYNKKKRKFYEQSFDYEELKNELQTFLKQ